ncbi:hypothetical protein [Rhizobium laguerreae]|uniref:hypothetical protein n=1 Tax=Rhizobium laguerreae TaxID=1076926 RepID=UPI001C90D160|nr:hypothetical protein [Rhizobium laguerreae]MBY3220908.1 hypothetical protein [Rhizobium laguerreae]
MWWGRKQNTEWLPWYRVPGFKGKVSEAEKRQLDAFRTQERHPAASYQDLPEEVQSYISRLELENYDFKQEKAANGSLFVSVLGATILGVNYFGVHIQPAASIWPYAFGLLLLLAPWFVSSREWQRNADELHPRRHGGPNMTDENIRKEWELDFLTRHDPEDGSKT